MTERKPYRLPVTNTKTPMPDVKAPRVDIGSPMNPPDTVPYAVIVERDMTIHLLKNENHRLRAALLTWTFDNTSDDERTEFEYAIMELKAALSGENYDDDMKCIAKFNHDNINIDEVK